MSEGAIRSAPARAWLTATRASSFERGVVVDDWWVEGRVGSDVPQDAAVAVVGVLAEAHVGEDEQLR